ncbi:hypothetical protein G7Y89_g703 [Cudoniella acicularis]|uniref:NADP-dependent oxidoreductase domain-containing protein n=1 Tax=Cudoniella acicularis TaxID=354080 RepID=A0A8H4WAY6_9HELO|nr:hypothetical protein G7Y89_g703 [Cudoniella acicularis]
MGESYVDMILWLCKLGEASLRVNPTINIQIPVTVLIPQINYPSGPIQLKMPPNIIRLMPPLGVGTFRLKDEAVQQALKNALDIGYRHIDAAAIYHNEKEIGDVLQKIHASPSQTITRSDIWITSKLSPYDMKTPRTSLLKTLASLQTEYLDLYLIHWPGMARKSSSSPENKKLRIQAWNILNEAKKEGLVRHIGVSNFTSQHIQELEDETEYGIQGLFVQMEIHPWYWRDAEEIQKRFEPKGASVVGYALLAEGKLLGEHMRDVLDEIAERLESTRVQVVMSWALKKGFGVLVRSTSMSHLRQNLDAASLVALLTAEDCAAIDNMSSPDGEEKRCWDPRLVK